MSLLWMLHLVNSCGGFDAMIDVEGGAQQDRIVGGSQAICVRMAEELGDSVVLGAPVELIEQDPDGVRVRADGFAVSARRAVVAMPPALTTRIRFAPNLSGQARPARAVDGERRPDQVHRRLRDAVLARGRPGAARRSATRGRSRRPSTTPRPTARPG